MRARYDPIRPTQLYHRLVAVLIVGEFEDRFLKRFHAVHAADDTAFSVVIQVYKLPGFRGCERLGIAATNGVGWSLKEQAVAPGKKCKMRRFWPSARMTAY